VYCAHDSVYSEQILEAFEAETGVEVEVRFDTEATKSLGLTELIARERDNPRCDVFWNNEQLGTSWLKEQGVLEAYKGAGYERIPAGMKDAEGYWTGFGARLRVWIVNTGAMEAEAGAIAERLASEDLSRVAIAKPLFGTTRTQYTALWDRLGREGLIAWHNDWRARGGLEVSGNATVKNLVAEGVCDLGLTDTDDYFVAKDAGQPVAAAPYRLNDGATIAIPNTVAIVKKERDEATRRSAERLVEYLLSARVEVALANSASRQVPLGPVDESKIPTEVRELREWAAQGCDLSGLGAASAACLGWLKREYVR
jgi:iron(III) transport system substrate-binding protein